MTPQSKTVANLVAERIDSVRKEIMELIANDPNLHTIQMRTDKQLQLLSNQIKAIIGISPDDTTATTIEFGPLLKLDGDDITGKSPADVSESELNIKKDEVAALKEKVLRFEESFHTRTDDEVLEAIITTDDTLIIRGLAKKANVSEFDTATIDHAFVQSIREGLDQLKEAKKSDNAALVAQIKAADTIEQVKELAGENTEEAVLLAKKQRLEELGYDPKAELLLKIKQATTDEEVKELATGNDDEEIQDAALIRLIEIEGGGSED